MKRIITTLILLLITNANTFAQFAINTDHILNPDFATQIGIVESSHEGVDGIFVTSPQGEVVLAMTADEVESMAMSVAGKYLLAYDESGQALYINEAGEYEMALTINGSSINLNYLPGSRNCPTLAEDERYLDHDVILQESADDLYHIVLLTTGELQVQMYSTIEGIEYQVTFTGIPPLNIEYSSSPVCHSPACHPTG